MTRMVFVAVVLMLGGWASAQDDTANVDPATVKEAYARLEASKHAAPATQPMDSQAEIRKLRQEVAQLQDQVLALKTENFQLRQKLGLGAAVTDGHKARRDYEDRIKAYFDQNRASAARVTQMMGEAAKVDKDLDQWCAANSPEQDLADALWAGKVEIGMPWDAVNCTGTGTVESETADVKVIRFIPFFDFRNVDLVTVEDGKITAIDHETQR